MKKLIKIILLVIALTITPACNRKENDAIKFKNEYESLNGQSIELNINENNPIKYASYDEIIDVLNGTGVIYFGFPECPWCRNALPVLLDAASETQLGKIYYYNALSIRDVKKLDESGNIVTEKEGTDEYYKLVDILSSHLGEYTGLNDPAIKRLYFPTIVFVKEGKIISIHVSTLDSQTDPFTPLDDNQRTELKNIYKTGIQKVLNYSCDDAC